MSVVTRGGEEVDTWINDKRLDDVSIEGYASKAGEQFYPDPDIAEEAIGKKLHIQSIHECFNKPVKYNKDLLFPSWILQSKDWKSLRGIIQNRDLMDAFKQSNHLREPSQIDLIRTWLGKQWDMARHLGPRR